MHHSLLFNDKSDLYRAARPSYPNSIYSFLAQQCESTQLVWDSACGNGQAANSLAVYFDRVFASDVSQQQIEAADRNPKIDYHVGASEHSKLADNSVDLVCVAQALHWFNFDEFWPEVLRVLKPDAVFATWGYNFPDWGDVLSPLIKDQILDPIASYWAPHNQLLWDHYRHVEFPFQQIDAPAFAMHGDWNLYQLFDLIHTFSATRRCMDDRGDDFFKQAFKDAHTLWCKELGDPEEKQRFELDFVFYSGRNSQ